jgi:glutathione S-transferase
MSIRLYDLAAADERIRFSPYCWRIKMALAHKGLPVEALAWRFTDKEAIAPTGQGRVPVLVDGEQWLHESWDIALYLDSRYPERPRLIAEGAIGETWFIKHWTEAMLHPVLLRLIVADIHAILADKDQDYFRTSREKMLGRRLEEASEDRDADIARLHSLLEPLRRAVAGQPFIAGKTPGFADYIPFGTLQWTRCVTTYDLLAPDDPVSLWFERMLDLYDGLGRSAPRPLSNPARSGARA